MAEDTKLNPELDTVSPIVAAAAGGNVHQAKMAGTNAAKQGVAGIPSTNVRQTGENVNGAIPTSKPSVWSAPAPQRVETQKEVAAEGLSDVDRTKLVTETRKQNAEDKRLAQESLDNSQSLSQLGAVGESIKNVLKGNINQIFDAKGTLKGDGLAAIAGNEVLLGDLRKGISAKAKYIDAAGKEISGDDAVNAIMNDITSADNELDALVGMPDEAKSAASTEKMNRAISALATSLGDTDGNLSFDTLKNIFPDEQKLLGTLASSSLADNVLVDDKLMTQMFTDEGGVPDQAEIDKVKGMLGLTGKETVTELRAKIDNYMGTEFKDITDLEDVLRDNNRSPEERRQALEQLRDKGYTGAMASREEITQTADSIRDFDEGEISFLGNTYPSLEVALNDDSIMGAVSDYLNGNLDRGQIPGPLADFIDANRNTFSAAMNEMEKEVGDFNSRQEQWKEIKSLFPDSDPASKAVLDMLGFKSGQPYQTGVLNVSKMPALDAIVSKREPDATNARGLITRIQSANVDSETRKTILNNLSAKDINELAADPKGTLANDYISAAALKTKLSTLDPTRDVTGDGKVGGLDILSQLFGDSEGASIKDLSDKLADYESLKDLLPADTRKAIEDAFGVAGMLSSQDATQMTSTLNNMNTAINQTLGSLDSFKKSRAENNPIKMISDAVNAISKAFTPAVKTMAENMNNIKNGQVVSPEDLFSGAAAANIVKPIKGNDGEKNREALNSQLNFINSLPQEKRAQYQEYVYGQITGPSMGLFNTLVQGGRADTSAITKGDQEVFSNMVSTLLPMALSKDPVGSKALKPFMDMTFNNRISPSWGDISNLGMRIGGFDTKDLGLSPEEAKALGVDKGGFMNSNLRMGNQYYPARQSILEGYATYKDLIGQPASSSGFRNYVQLLKRTRGSIV